MTDLDLENVLIGDDDVVPRARYTSAQFAALEFDHLWARVWQVACREEELPEVGDYCEYLIGDQSNQNPVVPAYWVVNLNTSYQVNKNVELFGLVRNLFNRHYYVSGTFFQTDSFPFLNLTDPRSFVPGMPLAAYAGLRVKW